MPLAVVSLLRGKLNLMPNLLPNTQTSKGDLASDITFADADRLSGALPELKQKWRNHGRIGETHRNGDM